MPQLLPLAPLVITKVGHPVAAMLIRKASQWSAQALKRLERQPAWQVIGRTQPPTLRELCLPTLQLFHTSLWCKAKQARGLVPYPAVAADTAAGLGLSVMRAEADSKVTTSTEGMVPTDPAVSSDFLVRKGVARRGLVQGTKRSELDLAERELMEIRESSFKVKFKCPRTERGLRTITRQQKDGTAWKPFQVDQRIVRSKVISHPALRELCLPIPQLLQTS